MALQGVPYPSHAVVGCEVVELREDLPLPVDAITQPAITRPLSSACLPLQRCTVYAAIPLEAPTNVQVDENLCGTCRQSAIGT